MSPRVILVGVPGSGKTTVGAELSQAWQEPFRDTDADVSELTGKSVADIFIQDGEPYFRTLEHDAVTRALAEHDGVLALGGGAILDPRTRAALRGQPVVWLQVGLSDAVARVGLNGARPVLMGNVRGRLHALMQERAAMYSEVARLTVDTDGRTPADVAASISAALEAPA